MAKPAPQAFRFAATDTIGAAGAEDDREYLAECFVDTGVLGLLRNMNDNRLIVIGRTGAGKSALLAALADDQSDRVIRVSPEQLALSYVANSTILNFFADLGVNVDPFLKLLWRHVLTVEILSRHFASEPSADGLSWIERLKRRFMGTSKKDKDMLQAVAYLENWGKSFWQDTEYRVKEITNQVEKSLESTLSATIGPKSAAIGSSAKGSEVVTETERAELVAKGQDIISKAQLQDLHKVLQLLDTILEDRQAGYYLVVDGLDENWVEDRLRYKLVMALMQTARDFREVRNAKVVVALRRDLIDRVFRLTRDSGFQEEKYQSLYLPLVWTPSDLLRVLDKRVARLVSRRYTKAPVSFRDLMPRTVAGKPVGEYITTLAPRPRDVIAFFNICIQAVPNQSHLSAGVLKLAEGEYSRGRLRALGDEWSSDYPTLVDFTKILQRRPPSFKPRTVTDGDVSEICLNVAANSPGKLGSLAAAMQVADGVLSPANFKIAMFGAFYHVGLIGLKTSPHQSVSWVDELGKSVSLAQIDDDTSAVVHPAFRRALGIVESRH
jgi:hypothetical protein